MLFRKIFNKNEEDVRKLLKQWADNHFKNAKSNFHKSARVVAENIHAKKEWTGSLISVEWADMRWDEIAEELTNRTPSGEIVMTRDITDAEMEVYMGGVAPQYQLALTHFKCLFLV